MHGLAEHTSAPRGGGSAQALLAVAWASALMHSLLPVRPMHLPVPQNRGPKIVAKARFGTTMDASTERGAVAKSKNATGSSHRPTVADRLAGRKITMATFDRSLV